MSPLIEAVERPAFQVGVVLPFGQACIHRSKLRARSPMRDSKEHVNRRHDDTRVAHGHHCLFGEVGRDLLAHRADSLVEGPPTVATWRKHTLRLCFHVEQTVSGGIVAPRQAIGLTGMDLAEITSLVDGVQTEREQ